MNYSITLLKFLFIFVIIYSDELSVNRQMIGGRISVRIITGTKRGMKLFLPPEDAPIRPTSDRTKESVFNLIHRDFDGTFLDLFAGSGQMGIEALSRGAVKTVFCDNNKAAIDTVNANLKKTGFKNYEIFYGDYKKYLKTTAEKFDMIFIDPPYEKGLVQKALDVLGRDCSCIKDDGWVVVECKFVEDIQERFGKLVMTDRRKYGIASILIYRPDTNIQAEVELQ